MHTTNSSGRRVSLLNDDEPSVSQPAAPAFYTCEDRDSREEHSRLDRSSSYNSQGSSPKTPDLLRSDSYDSRMTIDPMSPLTPSLMEFGRQSSYISAYPDPTQYDQRPYGNNAQKRTPQSSSTPARPTYPERASSSFDEDQSLSERPISGKRYPCRFRDSHGCDKTFTTSGHASRHSKIHTAEKCVQCSFQGCHKKFTRADNMKQHLETHYKERTRSLSTSHKASTSVTSKLTMSAGINKPAARTSRPPSRNGRPESRPLDMPASYYRYSDSMDSALSPGTSPMESYGSLDMDGFRRALPNGLDALVDAVDYHSRN